MNTTKQIQSPIAAEMQIFERKFLDNVSTRVSVLNKIMHYIVRRKGKQMRPMFVFLMAKYCNQITESTYRAASLVELMHTATLVHDDVIDDSNLRRGFFSVNAIWKNKIAVLVGDFLLSKSLLMSVENEDYEQLRIISKAIREISEGELLQMEKSRKLDITESVYFEIIKAKTASLISACCELGAHSSTVTQEIKEKAALFGEKAGLAFQIKDDLFDYSTTNLIGKPIGIDIKEKKMTLPLIHVFSQLSDRERTYWVKKYKRSNKSKNDIQEIIDFVKSRGGLDYAAEIMQKLISEAKQILSEIPTKSETAKNSLEMMLDYVVNRNK